MLGFVVCWENVKGSFLFQGSAPQKEREILLDYIVVGTIMRAHIWNIYWDIIYSEKMERVCKLIGTENIKIHDINGKLTLLSCQNLEPKL